MAEQTRGHAEVPPAVVARLRSLCLALPEAYEEQAWAGTRWCVRRHNFAHVVRIEGGWPPAYARAASSDGPLTVLTFRSSGPELDALRHLGHPFFIPVWWHGIVGVILQEGGVVEGEGDQGYEVGWAEVTELITDSYCLLAPRKLVALVDRPSG